MMVVSVAKVSMAEMTVEKNMSATRLIEKHERYTPHRSTAPSGIRRYH